MALGNIGDIMKIKQAWDTFTANHPKFPAFMQAVQRRGIQEDSVIEIIITDPSGEKLETSIKVKQSDLQLMDTLKAMGRK